MRSRTRTLMVAALIGSAMLTSTAHAGSTPPPIGDATAYLADCLWGAEGPPLGFYLPPAVVKSQGCLSMTLSAESETFSGGSAQLSLPAGMTVTKKIAAPSLSGIWFPPSTCRWSGSYSVLSAGKAQTLRLNNVWCDPGESLVVYFTAKIANPVNADYLAFNALNQISVWEQFGEASGCWPALTGFPYLLGGAYQYVGTYVVMKGGPTTQLNNANREYPMPLMIAADNDYYRWWQWISEEFDPSCLWI